MSMIKTLESLINRQFRAFLFFKTVKLGIILFMESYLQISHIKSLGTPQDFSFTSNAYQTNQ